MANTKVNDPPANISTAALTASLFNPDNIKAATSAALLFIYQLILAVYVENISPINAPGFRAVFFPGFALAVMPVILARLKSSNSIAAPLCVGLLTETGIALQSSISSVNGYRAIVLLSIVAVTATAAVIRCWDMVKSNKRLITALYWALTAILACVGIPMRLILSEHNGAFCWLTVGGTSIQLTELLRLAFVVTLFIATVIAKSDRDLFTKVMLPTAAFCFSLIVVNEGGTMMVAAITAVLVIFFLTKSHKVLLTELGIIIGLAGLLLIALAIMKTVLKDSEEGITATLYAFSSKIFNRLTSFISPEGADNYQINKAMQAMALGKLFGSDSNFIHSLPEFDSDFVLASVCSRFGVLITFFVIIAFAAFFLCSIIRFRADDAGKLLIICACSLGIQSLLVIMSDLNLVPVVGLTLPLLSSGGSSFVCCSVLFAAIILCMSGNNNIIKREEAESID